MRDREDRQTGNLLQSGVAKRQARYAERQAEKGRKRRTVWLSDTEYDALKAMLEDMRSGEG